MQEAPQAARQRSQGAGLEAVVELPKPAVQHRDEIGLRLELGPQHPVGESGGDGFVVGHRRGQGRFAGTGHPVDRDDAQRPIRYLVFPQKQRLDLVLFLLPVNQMCRKRRRLPRTAGPRNPSGRRRGHTLQSGEKGWDIRVIGPFVVADDLNPVALLEILSQPGVQALGSQVREVPAQMAFHLKLQLLQERQQIRVGHAASHERHGLRREHGRQEDPERLVGEHHLPVVRRAEHDRFGPIDVAMDLDDAEALLAVRRRQLGMIDLCIGRREGRERLFDQLVEIGRQNRGEADFLQQRVSARRPGAGLLENHAERFVENLVPEDFPQRAGRYERVLDDHLPQAFRVRGGNSDGPLALLENLFEQLLPSWQLRLGHARADKENELVLRRGLQELWWHDQSHRGESLSHGAY